MRRYSADEYSNHEYEVKNLYADGKSFKTLVFYIQPNQQVNVQLEQVLRKTHLWMEPTVSEPKREYLFFLETIPQREMDLVDSYMCTFTFELEGDSAHDTNREY